MNAPPVGIASSTSTPSVPPLARRATTRAGAGIGASSLLGKPVWRRTFPLAGLAEDQVWSQLAAELKLDKSTPAARLMSYAFTEMLNNAVDHSGGTRVLVRSGPTYTSGVRDLGRRCRCLRP